MTSNNGTNTRPATLKTQVIPAFTVPQGGLSGVMGRCGNSSAGPWTAFGLAVIGSNPEGGSFVITGKSVYGRYLSMVNLGVGGPQTAGYSISSSVLPTRGAASISAIIVFASSISPLVIISRACEKGIRSTSRISS